MKKMLLITAVMLGMFATLLIYASGRVTESWQAPQEDSSSIEISSTVDELLGDDIKEYKFNEVTECFVLKPNIDGITEPQDGMISYVYAAAYGGNALSKFYPDIAWEEKIFDVRFFNMGGASLPNEYGSKCGLNFGYEGTYSDENITASYIINPYSGEVCYFSCTANGSEMYNEIDDEAIIPSKELHDELIESATAVVEKMGYNTEKPVDKIIRVKSEASGDGDTDINEIAVHLSFETEKGYDYLKVKFSNNEQLNYPLKSYSYMGSGKDKKELDMLYRFRSDIG